MEEREESILELDEHLRRAGVAARRSVGPVTSPKRNSKVFFFLGLLGATSDDGRGVRLWNEQVSGMPRRI